MGFLERMYRSPLGRTMSFAARACAKLQKPYMVYGYFDQPSRTFHKYTRMSSTVTIMNQKALSVGDHVWVWHYSVLDATEELIIEEGCQLGIWVGIFTHGSESSIRLLGRQYVNINNAQRRGYTRGSVRIGAYSFVGAGSVVLPGVTVGRGCLIGAGTLVTQDVPDYSIVTGSPGKVKGRTIDLDAKFFANYDYSDTYFDQAALKEIKSLLNKNS
jgi:acetyltransferase-like isoleucine patch superfamily enzyme